MFSVYTGNETLPVLSWVKENVVVVLPGGLRGRGTVFRGTTPVSVPSLGSLGRTLPRND